MADLVSEEPTPLARPEPQPTVSRHRFGLAYLVLAAIVGTAVGLLVVLATRDNGHASTPNGPTWATWQPQTTGTLGVREIARHIAPRYHLANGDQLVSVAAGPMIYPTVQGPLPVTALVISSGRSGVRQERVGVAFPRAGVFYQMCGSQARCQIEGNATTARGMLLLREVVELALYTFHDLPEADTVVAFLPPAPGVQPSDPRYQRAIYLPREALASELGAPLARTLPGRTSGFTPASLTERDRNTVLGLLAGHLYHFDFQPASDTSALLQLTPLEF